MNKGFLSLGVKQSPHLLLTVAMQQAFQVLQMPVVELGEWLKSQIEQNPVLEYSEDSDDEQNDSVAIPEHQEIDFEKNRFEVLEGLDEDFESSVFSEGKDWTKLEEEKRLRQFQETLIPDRPSLFEHLMVQAKQVFSTEEELKIAESIIGNLDERGFLSNQIESPAERLVLKTIQTFDPPGIGAADLKESLLIQLRMQGKEKTLAYRIISEQFDSLVHNRIPIIEKKLKCSSEQLMETVKRDISPLNIHPGYLFREEPIRPIVPDVTIKKIEDQWTIEINQDPLPAFKVSEAWQQSFIYDEMSLKEKQYIRRHIASGRWLHRIIQRRHLTLKKITIYLLKKQRRFFDGETLQLEPMNLADLAKELGLHESTIARASSDKFLACPQGVFALKKFFTAAVISESGEKISNDTVKQLLAQLVDNEDKSHPLSDEQLSIQIKKMGVPCARRTVSKYRQALKIQSATHRRRYHSQK